MLAEISLKSAKRNELIDITNKVQSEISKAKMKDGVCLVFVPHTTAAVTINENYDADVKSDILKKLAELVPENNGYAHAEGNSDAHIKSSLMGSSVFIPIQNGKLILGTWQGIIFCEFDGPRDRKFMVKLSEF